eukprot:Phypoly_transcript_00355.p1 GENE.Phypoly_transcript_00355~~Phypoly_transcript_00355.p1  ORF type:complete len:1640 (+),score=387.43 Phypoly_transcript_00355:131-5050(+)
MEVCVSVTEARDLDPKDPNGKSDPFYIIGLANDTTKQFQDVNACVRSKTIFCTLDPVWDRSHRVHFISTSLSQKARIELWDKDFSGENEFEGYVLVDTQFAGQDAKNYWLDLLPRDSNDKVSGAVHVSITWHYNGGIHPSIKSNKEQRAARIFLSSTFVDMHDERETIMRRVMVELDQYCYERQVSLTYIDMRWGITDEMSKEYKTILSCLQEVNHSRPYFVGIIGQRYGWHQEQDGLDAILTKTFEHAAAFDEYEWINKFRDRSVTELEILHGFLLHPSAPEGHAFFYFRDPAYLDTLDAATRPKFEDTTPYAKENLRILKERIQNRAAQWNCTCVNYHKPEDIGDLLIADLKKAIDRDFPIMTSASSSVQKQRTEHENYAHQRCHVYVPRPQYYDILDQAVTDKSGGAGKYVLVTALSGGGKSSLIANWWRSRTHISKKGSYVRALLADTPTFIHFIGASVVSNSLNALLTRLYEEINASKGANESKIEKPKDEDLIKSFPKFLNAAAKRKNGLVIVFDAINQLPSKYHDLHWLPQVLPPKVYIVLSSTPEPKTLEALKQRSGEGKWVHLPVHPLESDERSKIVSQRLSKYGKKMTPTDIEKLTSHPCGSSPLFLTTVLLELCTIGYYAQFQEQLAAFLSCKDMPDLFQRVLARWEESFGLDLAESLLPILACSRSGVTEKTMQQATQVPPMRLSPMLSAMKQMLVVNQGMYIFGHTYLKEAVRKRYSAELQYKASRRLVAVLSKEPFDQHTAAQLPWLLVKILSNPLCKDGPEVQKQLANILLNLQNFMVFYEHDSLKYDLIKYWGKLAELDSKWKMGPKYVESALSASHPSQQPSSQTLSHPSHPPQPSTQPSQPATQPSQPPTHPSQPLTNPSQPSTQLPHPATHSAQSSTHPPQSSTHPPQSSAHPPQSSAHPPQPSTHPAQSSAHPPQSSTHPPQTSTHPTQPAHQTPAQATSKPASQLSSRSSAQPPTHPPAYTAKRRASISADPSPPPPPTSFPLKKSNPTSSTHTRSFSTSSALKSTQSQNGNAGDEKTKTHAPLASPYRPSTPFPNFVPQKSPAASEKDKKKSFPTFVPPSPSPAPPKGANAPEKEKSQFPSRAPSPGLLQKAENTKGEEKPNPISSASRFGPLRSSAPPIFKKGEKPKVENAKSDEKPNPTSSAARSGIPLRTPSPGLPQKGDTPKEEIAKSDSISPTARSGIPLRAPSPAPLSLPQKGENPKEESSKTDEKAGPISPSSRSVYPSPAPGGATGKTPGAPAAGQTSSIPPATLFALASFLFTVGLDHEARTVVELSLSEFEKVNDISGIARALYLLGVILRDLGFLADARKNLTQALELRIQLHGECNAEVATSLDQLGWLSKNTGEMGAAIQYFTRALNTQKKLFGNRHEEVASSLNGLGSILCELGDLPKAREYFDEALSIGTELFGNNHPNVAQSLHNLGVLCLRQEQWQAAHDYCERARVIRAELFGQTHVDIAASLSVLGTVLMQSGKVDLALEHFTKAHAIQLALLGSVHPEVATTLQSLGVLYKRMGNLVEARKYHDSALEIRIQLFGEFHPLVESSLHNLGSCCFSQGDLDKALDCFEKVLAMQTKRHGGHAHPRVQQSLGILENIAKRLGKVEEAKFYSSKITQKPTQ